MPIRNKTVEYSFNYITASIPALTSATHNPLVIHLPETGPHRTIQSAIVQTFFQQSPATAVTPTHLGGTIQFTGPTTSPIATQITASSLTNTGEAMTVMCLRDVTGFFQAYMSSSYNHVTCSLTSLLSQSVQPYTNIASKIMITYSYEELSSSQVLKTVRIPLEGRTGNLTTTLTAIDTIPALATYLPEANKTFRDIFFEIEVQGNTTAAAAPNPQLNLSINAESAWGDGAPDDALISANYYYRLLKRPDINVSSSITLSASTTNTNTPFPCLTAVLYATYEYDREATTSIFNSLMLPVLNEPGALGGENAFLRSRDRKFIPIVDEGPVQLRKSGVKVWTYDANALSINFAFNSQSNVTYNWAAALRGGPVVFQRTIDQEFSGSFSRGLNEITFDLFRTGTAIGTIGGGTTGLLYLNYTSSINPEGEGSNTKTIISRLKGFSNDVVGVLNLYTSSYPSTPYLPEDYYHLIGAGFKHNVGFYSATGYSWLVLDAQLNDNDFYSSGWQPVYINPFITDNEAGDLVGFGNGLAVWKKYPNDPTQKLLNLKESRNWRLSFAPQAAMRPQLYSAVTYHSRMFEKTGSIYPNPGSGQTVRVFRNDTGELVTTASTNANGQYVVQYPMDFVDLYSEVKVSDTQMGRSGLFRVSSSFQPTPPSPFDPLSIPQISLSLTDNYISSLWTDDTPNSYNLTQSVGAQVPDIGTLAGKTAPDFNGTTDYLETDTASFGDVVGATQFEIWAVYNVDSVTSDGAAYYEKAALAGDGADGWVALGLSSTAVQFGYNNGAIDYVATDTVSTLGTGPHVVRAWIDSSNLVNLRVDDRATVDAGSTFVGFRTFTTAEFRTGTNFDGTNHINGACHIWAFDGNLSSQDVADFYAYLNAEYGVTVP